MQILFEGGIQSKNYSMHSSHLKMKSLSCVGDNSFSIPLCRILQLCMEEECA